MYLRNFDSTVLIKKPHSQGGKINIITELPSKL